MKTKYPKQLEEGRQGWAWIHETNLPKWLPPGTAVRVIQTEPGMVMVETPAGKRGWIRSHKLNFPPMYHLEDESRWVTEGHPKILEFYRRELQREMERPKPGAWMVRYCRWVIERWAELEKEDVKLLQAA